MMTSIHLSETSTADVPEPRVALRLRLFDATDEGVDGSWRHQSGGLAAKCGGSRWHTHSVPSSRGR
jgi:hypothetical protein